MADKGASHRVLLPFDVEPEKYDLTMEPDFDKFMFDGTVKITVDVQVASDRITLHQRELTIASVKFTPHGESTTYAADEITTKAKEMTASFVFSEFLPVGKGSLDIVFRGVLNDQMAGFYRSQYTDSKGVKRHMATTQFEAIDARRCFPCWDEPARKAVFAVTLIYPADLIALSNMPQSWSEIRQDGKRVESFVPSPKMSTYLVAFTIGEFEYISDITKSGTITRVYCCPGNLKRCQYALKCAVRALEFYNEFFGIPYPLPKVDMVAIPDFAAGAMENWGLVTYREVALLCDEKLVSATQKQRICSVIAHELAHQWFGNLVTMQWWDDLWLNEGFANWMQTFASDVLHPEWNFWEGYVSTEQMRALQLDSLRSSHPIQVPIKRAEEVEEVFDAISYSKGGSVVRMLYAVLGDEKFQEGLRLYFKKHAYGNTETTHLWSAWSEVSGKDVPAMMESWTMQMGFPLVQVVSDPVVDGTGEISLQQRWFLGDGSTKPDDAKKVWFVPVFAGTRTCKVDVPVEFFKEKAGKIKCAHVRKDAGWVKLNMGQHIPMRVQYPSSMLKRLADDVASLPAEDRIGLLSDAYALSKAGNIDPIDLLTLLKGFTNEGNDKVWSELSAVLNGLNKFMKQGLSEECARAFTAFCGNLFFQAFSKVGWNTKDADSDNHKKLRSTLAASLANYCCKQPEVVAEANRRFLAFLEDPNDPTALEADIRPAVFSIAMTTGTEETFDKLKAAHDVVKDAAVRIHIYGAVGDSPILAVKKRVLEWALTPSVRSQDMVYPPLSVVLSGAEGADLTFEWFQKDFNQIYDRLGTTSMILFQNMVRISGKGFVTEEKATAVEHFWKSRKMYKMIEKTVDQTCEAIRAEANFLARLKQSAISNHVSWS